MPRDGFDRQLGDLQRSVLLLGSMVAKAVGRAVDALRERNAFEAQTVIDEDREIDDFAYTIEERALLLIATQQPMAGDLRVIASVIAISGELERIGDYAEGIAKVALLCLDEPPLKPLLDIPRMAIQVRGMLQRGLDAYIARDVVAARAIWNEDDEIDALQDQIYRELLTYMIEDTQTITRATRLLWVTHNLERIADRVTNICERTSYLVTGNRVELKAHGY